ncbi:amidohydrolase [Pseudarthrobacter sp. NPDC058362]|uniref:amidohydrolase n=1 Tax=Pseudarthrobacter sp. NPDC058362 TaxID=3346458 RepID=UPI003648B438
MTHPESDSRRAPVLYRNGSVYSAADPFATAMLVDGDTVAWVGSEQAASSIVDSSMDVIDLQGALVAPGFVDSHVHLTETGIALASLQLGTVRSARELLDAVAAAPGEGPVLGHGWDETTWVDATLPEAAELERAARGRQVYLARVDVHSALVSGSLASAAGLAALEGYDGGARVSRDAHSAARRATRKLPEEVLRRHQERALSEAAANGYVAVAEMGAPHIGGEADLRVAAAWNGTHAAGPGAYPEVLPYWGELATSEEHARELAAQFGGTVHGLAGDLNIDGSIGSRTAALRDGYSDAPGERGSLYLTVEEAAAHLAACSLAGLQGGFHVIGDAGLDAALTALDLAAAEVGEQRIRAAGHRFEHVEMIDAGAVQKLAHYAVTVSAQPAFDAVWGGPGGLYGKRLGERSRGMNPFATLYSAGVPVCFGSDSPVTPLRPWSSVRACLEHHTDTERISARAAFLGHTRAGWRAARYRNPMAGQLVPGAPASFAVWEVEELMVQVADGRVQSWSTDPRARTPLLPALDTGTDPVCLQTVRDGAELFASPVLRA